jgi:hypothetical protein
MSGGEELITRAEFQFELESLESRLTAKLDETTAKNEAGISELKNMLSSLLAKKASEDGAGVRTASPTATENTGDQDGQGADLEAGEAGGRTVDGAFGLSFMSSGSGEVGAQLESTTFVGDEGSISVGLVAEAVCEAESPEEAISTAVIILPAVKSTFECRSWWKCTKDNCLHCRARDRLDTLASSGSIKYPKAFQRPLYSRTSVFKYRSFPEWSVPVRPEDLKNSSCYHNYWRWVLGKIHSYWFYAGETMHKSIFVNTIIHIARMRIVWDPGG